MAMILKHNLMRALLRMNTMGIMEDEETTKKTALYVIMWRGTSWRRTHMNKFLHLQRYKMHSIFLFRTVLKARP